MWLWWVLGGLVVLIVVMEVVQARTLKNLGADTPRFVLVLRAVNLALLVGAIAYTVWAFFLRGR